MMQWIEGRNKRGRRVWSAEGTKYTVVLEGRFYRVVGWLGEPVATCVGLEKALEVAESCRETYK